jgi:hypothetical protein
MYSNLKVKKKIMVIKVEKRIFYENVIDLNEKLI